MLADSGRSVPGCVIYKTRPAKVATEKGKPGKSVWDLAIVVTDTPLPASLPLATELAPKGEIGISWFIILNWRSLLLYLFSDIISCLQLLFYGDFCAFYIFKIMVTDAVLDIS